jgi:hypothetical protein
MKAQPLSHFYRLHDNGWIAVVTQRGNEDFAAMVTREGEGGRLRNARDLAGAQRLADTAVPPGHICSKGCTGWFEVGDPSRPVDFTTTCPNHHSGSLSYTAGDVLVRLNTLSFWCLQCGRSWPATDEQRRHLLERILRSGSGSKSV